MATGPNESWQLKLLKPMLYPLRAHIHQILEWPFSSASIYQHSQRLISQGHQWFTHPAVTIRPLADGSELISPINPSHQATKLLLYFHGGAFLAGSPEAVRPITSYLVAKTPGLVCYSVRYPIINISLSALVQLTKKIYRRLLTEGWQANQLIIGGDSAGGHLALQLIFKLMSSGDLPMPAGLLLFSPWLDVTGELAQDDSLIYGHSVRQASARLLIGNDDDDESGFSLRLTLQDHPQLAKLPPIFLQFGESEIVAPENRLLADRAKQVGVAIEIDQLPAVFHGFHYFVYWLPESKRALDRASQFLSNFPTEEKYKS